MGFEPTLNSSLDYRLYQLGYESKSLRYADTLSS